MGEYAVAALYIDPRGPYPALLGADHCWDETRDARTYAGPWPVVAHPPCGPWGRLKHLCTKQPRELAPFAVAQVRKWGGVLEHPRDSGLFEAAGLPLPSFLPDEYGGRSILVQQCDWGHPARKESWLYIVGTGTTPDFPDRRAPTHWVSGSRDRARAKGQRGVCPPGIKICSAQQRRRTPPAFARWLIELAATATRGRCAQSPPKEK